MQKRLCCALVLTLGSCADPFPLDTAPKNGPSLGRSGGSGGSGSTATGSGGSSNAGGSTVPGNSGTGGSSPAAGGAAAGESGAASGGAGGSVSGAGGAGGSAAGGSGAGGGGAIDGGAGAGDARAERPPTMADAAADKPNTPPPKPDARPDTGPPVAVQLCPVDPPAPPGADVTCPAILAELEPWFPVTPPIKSCKPPAHPATECRFYQFSWQNFLIATQPDATGKPAFMFWDSIETVFGDGPLPQVAAIPTLGGGVTQAGGRQVLIDQRGHAIYYGIHMNRKFVDFVKANGLQNANAVRAADPNLGFPADVVELKEAWQVVSDTAPPANFIVTKAKVATLRVDPTTRQIVEDHTQLREVTVALIAIHIVYTLPGHPEFIWSTFEHVDARGITDVAPSAIANPEATPNTTVVNAANHILYRGGTTVANANRGVVTPMLDEATQTFMTPPTSIYRMFTGSKSNQTDIDDDVVSINENMTARLLRARLPAYDRRGNYRLVGAIWQDRPDKTFSTDKVLVNNENDPDIAKNGGDSPNSITGGEDRLSSTAMESFTQGKDSFPNCFSCHDTRAATARGVPFARDQTATVTMPAKLINVSHIFNEVSRTAP
jgi:hypothetical protein